MAKWSPGTRGHGRSGAAVIVVRSSEVKGAKGQVYRYWVTDPGYESPLRLLDVGGEFAADEGQEPERPAAREQLTSVLPGYDELVKKESRWGR